MEIMNVNLEIFPSELWGNILCNCDVMDIILFGFTSRHNFQLAKQHWKTIPWKDRKNGLRTQNYYFPLRLPAIYWEEPVFDCDPSHKYYVYNWAVLRFVIKVKPIQLGHTLGMRYSDNDWNQHYTEHATWMYNNDEYNEEVWEVEIGIAGVKARWSYGGYCPYPTCLDVEKLHFAIFLKDGNNEYWDNNNNTYYTVFVSNYS
jgi:hypothetical protein